MSPPPRRSSRWSPRSPYDDRAADAFDLGVADYVRKPVQAERLAESLRRVASSRVLPTPPAALARGEDEPTIPVELAGVTKLRLTGSGYVIVVDDAELPVSRRHTRDLKDRLVRAAKQDWTR